MKNDANNTPVPPTTTPLLSEGGEQGYPSIQDFFGPLQQLVGTWTSPSTDPTGFFVMPLPQHVVAPNNFIISAFPYFEEMTFVPMGQGITNRSGTYDQTNYALFYEERVYFGENANFPNPQANQLVHAENGTLMNVATNQQGIGPLELDGLVNSPPGPTDIPYKNTECPFSSGNSQSGGDLYSTGIGTPAPAQPPSTLGFGLIKQASVPHGNSILAQGNYTCIKGAPNIPNISTLPFGPGVNPSYYAPFGLNDGLNPVINPNLVLQDALTPIQEKITFTYVLELSAANPSGIVNSNFENTFAKVTDYNFTYWVEIGEKGAVLQIQYSQVIEMQFASQGDQVTFVHATANTVQPV